MTNYFDDVLMTTECMCTNESDTITDCNMSCPPRNTFALFTPVSIIISDDRHDDGVVVAKEDNNNSDEIDRLWD